VQEPPQPVLDGSPAAHQVFAVVNEQLHVPTGMGVLGPWNPRLADRGPGDVHRIERVALAARPGVLTGQCHQLWGHPDDRLRGGGQRPLQAVGELPAVLDRELDLPAELRQHPPQQLPMTGVNRAEGPIPAELTAGRINRNRAMGVLVDVDPNCDHHEGSPL